MQLHQTVLLVLGITCLFFHFGLQDGQKIHGEACSLRSQVANLFRQNDSPEGCVSAKGLVCLNNKCVCADPSNVWEVPEASSTSGPSASISNAASSASNFIKNLIKSTTTTTPPTVAVPTDLGGKCVGRAGSPCFTANSTCVKHASCEGTPRMCKCQGIYSSNAQGYCSKTSTVVTQVIKQTIG